MWPALTILLCLALVFVHSWWKRRFEQEQSELREQKTQNAALQEQQQHARAQAQAEQQSSFNSMVEGVLLLDDQERVRLVNQALEQLFGISGDLGGRTIMEALRLHELQELVHRVRAEGQVIG